MKNIIVTGGSGTIGTAIAEVLLRNGYKVYVVDVKEPEEEGEPGIYPLRRHKI